MDFDFGLRQQLDLFGWRDTKILHFFRIEVFLNISASMRHILSNNVSFCLFCFLIHFCYAREFFFELPCTQIMFQFFFYKFFSVINGTLLLPLPKQ